MTCCHNVFTLMSLSSVKKHEGLDANDKSTMENSAANQRAHQPTANLMACLAKTMTAKLADTLKQAF